MVELGTERKVNLDGGRDLHGEVGAIVNGVQGWSCGGTTRSSDLNIIRIADKMTRPLRLTMTSYMHHHWRPLRETNNIPHRHAQLEAKVAASNAEGRHAKLTEKMKAAPAIGAAYATDVGRFSLSSGVCAYYLKTRDLE